MLAETAAEHVEASLASHCELPDPECKYARSNVTADRPVGLFPAQLGETAVSLDQWAHMQAQLACLYEAQIRRLAGIVALIHTCRLGV